MGGVIGDWRGSLLWEGCGKKVGGGDDGGGRWCRWCVLCNMLKYVERQGACCRHSVAGGAGAENEAKCSDSVWD